MTELEPDIVELIKSHLQSTKHVGNKHLLLRMALIEIIALRKTIWEQVSVDLSQSPKQQEDSRKA